MHVTVTAVYLEGSFPTPIHGRVASFNAELVGQVVGFHVWVADCENRSGCQLVSNSVTKNEFQ